MVKARPCPVTTGLAGLGVFSVSHCSSAVAVGGSSGVMRSLRPLPWTRQVRRLDQVQVVASQGDEFPTRRRVVIKVNMMTGSRRPGHVERSGAARSATHEAW